MDIQAEKLELMRLLLNTDNPSIIESIKKVFRKDKSSDFWNDLSLEQQEEINKADIEIIDGETFDYNNFMSTHR